jgi:hypothetical protein
LLLLVKPVQVGEELLLGGVHEVLDVVPL